MAVVTPTARRSLAPARQVRQSRPKPVRTISFSSLTGWGDAGWNAHELVTDPTLIRRGAASTRYFGAAGNTHIGWRNDTLFPAYDIATSPVIRFYGKKPANVETQVVQLNLYSGSGAGVQPLGIGNTAYDDAPQPHDRWQVFQTWANPAYSANGFVGTATTGLEVRTVRPSTAAVPQHYVYDFVEQYAHYAGIPKLLWRFDDGWVSEHTVFAPYLEERGWRGMFGINPKRQDDNDTLFMTPAQLTDLDRRGHLLVNHTWNHLDWSNPAEVPNLNAARSEVTKAKEWLLEHGLHRGADILINPYEFYAVSGSSPHQTMDMIFEYNAVDCPTSPKYRGYENSGAAGGAADAYRVEPDRRIVWNTGADATVTTAMIDAAIARNDALICPLFHYAITAGEIAHFKTIVDYVKTKADAGQVKVVDPEEYFFG